MVGKYFKINLVLICQLTLILAHTGISNFENSTSSTRYDNLKIRCHSKPLTVHVFTPETNSQYQFYKAPPMQRLNFKVRAKAYAMVALTAKPLKQTPWVEIIIGGWGNTKNAIKKNGADVKYVEEPVLSSNEYRGFWITWQDGEIKLGKEGSENPFLQWVDTSPFNINYFGLTSCCGSNGSWLFEAPTFTFDENDYENKVGGYIEFKNVIELQKDILKQMLSDQYTLNSTKRFSEDFLQKITTDAEENFSVSKKLHDAIFLHSSCNETVFNNYLNDDIFRNIRYNFYTLYNSLTQQNGTF